MSAIGQWVRWHVWPWTAIRRVYAQGFTQGVELGGRAVAEHVRTTMERVQLEERRRHASTN